jgi:HSP20 family protein
LDDWDPFKEMHSMHDRINQMFGSAFNRFEQSDDFGDAFNQYAFSPDINIEDKGSHYLVTVDLPGLEDSELEINVNGQILTISGTTRSEKIDERDSRMLRQERRSGKFSRSVTLPGLVRADKMEANQDNGVLSIKLPKDD